MVAAPIQPTRDRPRPRVELSTRFLSVDPGQQAQVDLTVTNVGTKVVHLALGVVEDCAARAWSTVTPSDLNLLRGQSGTATVRFHPPYSTDVRPGTHPFAIRVVPGEDDDQRPVVVEGDLAVGAIHAVEARLVPIRNGGRWRGRYRLDLHNRGSEVIRVGVAASDDEDQRRLQFAVGRDRVVLQPQGKTEVYLNVRPDRPKLAGAPVAHGFVVRCHRLLGANDRPAVTGERDREGLEIPVPGSFRQYPVFSRLMIMAGVLGIAAVAFLLGWRQAHPEATLAPPPDPPGLKVQATESVVSFEADRRAGEAVEAVIVSCDDAAEIHEAIGESAPVEPGPGPAFGTIPNAATDGAQVCVQARVTDEHGARSRWSFYQATVNARLAFEQVTPVVSDRDAGMVTVEWDAPVVNQADLTSVTYEVLIDGQTQEPQIQGVLTWSNREPLEPGLRQFRVRATLPDGTTQTSNIAPHEIIASQVAVPPKDYWIYFNHATPPQPPTWGQNVELVIQALGSPDLTREQLKRKEVGKDVVVPDDAVIAGVSFDARPAEGDVLLLAEGYESAADAERACHAFNNKREELREQLISDPVTPCTVVSPT